MILHSFTPIFELSAALSIGYASIPQLGQAVNDMFFRKITTTIEDLEKKIAPAKSMLKAIDSERIPEDIHLQIDQVMDKEIKDTSAIKESIQSEGKTEKEKISEQMKLFFVIVSFLSSGYLYIAGITDGAAPFPVSSLVNLYMTTLLVVLTVFLYKQNGIVWKNIVLLGTVSLLIWLYWTYGTILCNHIALKELSNLYQHNDWGSSFAIYCYGCQICFIGKIYTEKV